MGKQGGFGIIEIIVAMGIFMTIAVVGVTTVVGSFSTNRLGDEQTQATLYAQQGIEAARSIKNQGWDDPFLLTDCSGGCGVSSGGGSFAWSGTSDTSGDYTRVVTVEGVERDGNGDIVASGGSDDPNTKRVTSVVSWDFTGTRSNSVELVTYLTNWDSPVPTPTPANCDEYVVSLGYTSGTCRQNSNQCSNNNEDHLVDGDALCTGGPSSDTCCGSPAGGTPTPTPTATVTPTPTSGPTATPTPTPVINSCSSYCANNGFSSGICRQNKNQCRKNGQTHQPGGDVYCNGGPSADTCCCTP